MKNSVLLRSLVWLILPVLLICGLSAYIRPGSWKPVRQSDLLGHTVYAYRQWQSISVKLQAGDWVDIRASGEWQYSPYVGLNGPEGGMWAPDWYPMPGDSMPGGVKGGALLGRIGEQGKPFYVGPRYRGYVEVGGVLYLRINDDLLGDNLGQLAVEIEVTPAEDSETGD